MPGTGGRDYYIITVQGERGPVDRVEMRELLTASEIRSDFQVRNAFGRNLGTVALVLATPSDRQGATAQHPGSSRAHPAPRSTPVVPIIIVVLLLVVAAIIWLASSSHPTPAPQAREPAPMPATPTPVPAADAHPPQTSGPMAITASGAGQRSAALAGDGDLCTCWRMPLEGADTAGRLGWIRYQTGSRRIPAYALALAGNPPAADPSAWRLVGLLADGQERILDIRQDEVFPGPFQRRVFPIAQPAACLGYRLEILAVRQAPLADHLQIAEFSLLDDIPTTTPGLPAGWSTDSIGNEGSPPPAFDGGLWTLHGAGRDIAGTADQFRFVHTAATGDATITALLLASNGMAGWAKPGLMLRSSVQNDAPYVHLTVSPQGAVEFNHRPVAGAKFIPASPCGASLPAWLRLTRRGSQVTGSMSINGVNWRPLGTLSFPAMSGPLLAGLVACSKEPGKPMTVLFTQVTVSRP